MSTTLTTKVAQVVKAMTGKGTVIFNDPLSNGGRSLKVWGWTQMEYGRAQAMLSEAGCKAEIVVKKRRGQSWTGKPIVYNLMRLHVVE
jgi:hypothetical protein